MPLLTWQLWLAREIAGDNPLPWQKSISIVNKMTLLLSCSVDFRSFSGDWYTATFLLKPVESLQVGLKGSLETVEFVIQLSKKVLYYQKNHCQNWLDLLTNYL